MVCSLSDGLHRDRVLLGLHETSKLMTEEAKAIL